MPRNKQINEARDVYCVDRHARELLGNHSALRSLGKQGEVRDFLTA